MQFLIERVRLLRVDRRGIIVETLLFILIYALLLFVIPQDAPARAFTETLAIITSALTAAILVFLSIPALEPATRPAWFMLALALLVWAIADFLRTFYLLLGTPFFFFALFGFFFTHFVMLPNGGVSIKY